MIIAIDGPAGSGKSSTAKAVARELGFQHLDSGAFYRALTHAALSAGWPVTGWHHLASAQLDSLRIRAEPSHYGHRFTIDGRDITAAIRSPEVNAHVSQIARVPAVREWLLDQLRAAGTEADLVADGRDIGTVVFPGAELKIFLTANPRERARRRLIEQGIETTEEELDHESRRLGSRDRIDSEREVAPLRAADNAIVLDSTLLTFDEQVQRIVSLARQRAARA